MHGREYNSASKSIATRPAWVVSNDFEIDFEVAGGTIRPAWGN